MNKPIAESVSRVNVSLPFGCFVALKLLWWSLKMHKVAPWAQVVVSRDEMRPLPVDHYRDLGTPKKKRNLHQSEFHFMRRATKQVSDSERERLQRRNELAYNWLWRNDGYMERPRWPTFHSCRDKAIAMQEAIMLSVSYRKKTSEAFSRRKTWLIGIRKLISRSSEENLFCCSIRSLWWNLMGFACPEETRVCQHVWSKENAHGS